VRAVPAATCVEIAANIEACGQFPQGEVRFLISAGLA